MHQLQQSAASHDLEERGFLIGAGVDRISMPIDFLISKTGMTIESDMGL
jgi:hypothetical protein